MRLGAHMSAAGGLHEAFKRGHDAGCDSMLVFTKSNRQWAAKPITAEDEEKYRQAQAQYSHIFPVAVHDNDSISGSVRVYVCQSYRYRPLMAQIPS